MIKLKNWCKNNKHVVWALCLPVILLLYYIPEQIVVDEYTATQLAIDYSIPFVSEFIVAYVLWFPMLAVTGLYLLFADADAFKRYMWFLTAAYALSAVVFLLFPNGQDLRPTSFEENNIFTRLCSMIYTADTNTNVLPSLHVICSCGVVFATFDSPRLKAWWIRAAAIAAALCVSAATLLVKQHAAIDLLASAVFSVVLYFVFYKFAKSKMSAK